jgi:RNA recognition motif-containing protein
MSETLWHGRHVLIKDARDFTKKTPVKNTANSASKSTNQHPPSVTLFVGNLPFETTKTDLQKIFSAFGKIRKVRLMTFEDSGKCKGFAYIDFKELDSAKAAMSTQHYLNGRQLRVEYGSEEAVRRGAPWIYDPKGLLKKKKSTTTTTTTGTGTINTSVPFQGQKIVFEDNEEE